MRTIFALAAAVFGVSCVSQESIVRVSSYGPGEAVPANAAPARQEKLRYSVDLARPGALDRLEKSNPEHYAKIMAVQQVASQPSCVEDLQALRVALKLDDARCAAMTTLTSYPPKRNVSVTIDGVHYMTYTPLGFAPARSIPLVAAPKILPAP